MAPLLHPNMSSSSSDDSSDSDSSVDTKTAYSGKLPKLIDNGQTNNYGEWRIQSQTELRSLGLWKYIEGPDSIPPTIPPICADEYLEGSDDEGNVKVFHIRGNTKEHKEKIRAAKPWMKKNGIVLAKIFRSLASDQLHFCDRHHLHLGGMGSPTLPLSSYKLRLSYLSENGPPRLSMHTNNGR